MPGISVPDFSLPPHPCYQALPTYTCSMQIFSLPTLTLGPIQWLMLPATSLCFYDAQPCSSPPALEGLLSPSGAQPPTPPLQCRPSMDLHPQPTPPYCTGSDSCLLAKTLWAGCPQSTSWHPWSCEQGFLCFLKPYFSFKTKP